MQDEVGEFRDVIEKLKREGFVRVRIDGEIIELGRPEPIRLEKGEKHRIEVVVDRLVIREGVRTRLADSVDTALKWGGNRLVVLRGQGDGGRRDVGARLKYSIDYSNPETGFTLPPLTPKHFSFNSHLGACPVCHGIGTELVCDAELMIPDPDKSLAEGAVAPWAKANKRMQGYYAACWNRWRKEYRVSLETPYRDLPEEFQTGAVLRHRRARGHLELGRERQADQGGEALRRARGLAAASLRHHGERVHAGSASANT